MPPATQPFPLLAAPKQYVACNLDLRDLPKQRGYWIGLFRTHFPGLLDAYRREARDRGIDVQTIERRAADASDRFQSHLDRVEAELDAGGRLTILSICEQREAALRAAGIDDPYRLAKQVENRQAIALLPALLEHLDGLPGHQRNMAVLEGIFAGNIFDLGATQTVAMFTDQRVDFHAVRAALRPRPWRYDAADAWLSRIQARPYKRAVIFVDNAGPDIVLGMLPFTRELLRAGAEVLLTANSAASLNDITAAELEELLAIVAQCDPLLAEALGSGRLSIVPSGNGLPLIDLSRVSRELAEAVRARPVDLVVLEGMGRAVESNFDAAFTCDALKLCMLKDRGVADELDAEVFDLVMRFERSPHRDGVGFRE